MRSLAAHVGRVYNDVEHSRVHAGAGSALGGLLGARRLMPSGSHHERRTRRSPEAGESESGRLPVALAYA